MESVKELIEAYESKLAKYDRMQNNALETCSWGKAHDLQIKIQEVKEFLENLKELK